MSLLLYYIILFFYDMLRNLRGLALTFVRNRGELAEGWYDPATFQKTVESTTQALFPAREVRRRRRSLVHESVQPNHEARVDSSDDDGIGPSLPTDDSHYMVGAKSSRSGPTIPGLQELELQRGMCLSISATVNFNSDRTAPGKPTANI